MKRIVQIIPAPEGTRISYLTPNYDDRTLTKHDQTVACLALVEDEKGARFIEPAVSVGSYYINYSDSTIKDQIAEVYHVDPSAFTVIEQLNSDGSWETDK